MADNTQTIAITNFGGRLTRKINGEMNSGFAKFSSSFGYDPFSKPDNLTWFEQPVDIDPNTSVITDLILDAVSSFEGGILFFYAIGHTGKIYKIRSNSLTNPNLDSVSLVTTLIIGSPTFLYGASISFFDSTTKLYIGHDNGVTKVNTDGTSEAAIAAATSWTSSKPHILAPFVGNLYVSDGSNIAEIITGGTCTTNTKLTPGLPSGVFITDVEVNPDLTYLTIVTQSQQPEDILDVVGDAQAASASSGFLVMWNGTDRGATTGNVVPSFGVTALHGFLNDQYFMANDAFGASINKGADKIITLDNNKAPFPPSLNANGNMLTFTTVENANSTLNASMYYYGQFDQENQPGLWRLFRQTSTQTNGFIYQSPFNTLVNNKYTSLNAAETGLVTFGYGKHYFSTFDVANGGGTTKYKLFRFLVTSSGSGTPILGTYETQTQLFSKKITVKQVRVYSDPTATGNGFQIDMIGSDGSVITNGSKTYTFAAGTDPTIMQGSFERVDMNFSMKDTFALGLRVTNTGTTNMTIRKVEVDYVESGK